MYRAYVPIVRKNSCLTGKNRLYWEQTYNDLTNGEWRSCAAYAQYNVNGVRNLADQGADSMDGKFYGQKLLPDHVHLKSVAGEIETSFRRFREEQIGRIRYIA